MKKIFTLFAALAMVMSMSAKPYLRGSMNGWGSTEFQNGECTVNLTANTKYEFKVDENNDWKTSYGGAAITSTNCTDVKLSGSSNATIQSTFKGDYKFKWNASNKTITVVYPTEEVVKPKKDITVKAKMPAEWTKTIDAWVWTDENPNGKAVTPERDGDWYVVTQNTAASYIIFRNGASWNGDSNQTADMRFEDNACIQLQYNASAKASYINIDCADDTEDPTPDPEDPVDPNPGDDPVVEPETGVTYNVTVPVGTKACYIAGEMNGWSQQEMTKVDETHYTITIAEATTAMKYKYCSGPDWAYVEMQADGVTDVQDRTYSANDVVEAWKAVYEPAGEEPGEDPGDDPVVEPDGDVWTVLGVDALGLNWTIEATDNDMVKQADGSYKLVKENLELGAGNYDYKVAKNHSWDISIPAGSPNQTLTIETSGIYNVTFVLDAACTTLTATAELVQAGEVIPVVGMHGNFLGSWADTEKFTMAADKLTASLVLTIPVGEYEFGMQIAGVWTANGTAFTRENTSAAIVGTSPNNTLSADVEGEYTFTWIYETSTLTIAYPVAGDDPVDPETAVDNVAVGEKAVKVIRNGQMYIIRNGVIYNAMGQIAE